MTMTALYIAVLVLLVIGSTLALYGAWWCDRMEKRIEEEKTD